MTTNAIMDVLGFIVLTCFLILGLIYEYTRRKALINTLIDDIINDVRASSMGIVKDCIFEDDTDIEGIMVT